MPTEAERPNVLLVTADQWRGDVLGSAGHPLVRTPALDALAGEGVAFRRHFASASPCGPARASLLTGLYLMNHRSVANGTPLDRGRPNLATEARRAGLRPVLIGYTDTTPDPRGRAPDDPDLRGYEGVLEGFEPACRMWEDPQPWRAWLIRRGYRPEDVAYPAVYAHRPELAAGAAARGATFPPTLYPAEESDTAFLADRAIDWLGQNGAEGPWLLHVSFLRPHPPWAAPAPYHALYDAADAPPPRRPASFEAAAAEHPLTRWFLERETRQAYFPDAPAAAVAQASLADVLQARATYYGLVSEVDANLARLFQALRDLGQWEKTLVVFTSDHGEQLGDRFRFGKRGHHDEAFHIPLIVKPAGAPRGGRAVDAYTEAVDVAPTVLEAIGAEAPAAMDGLSLLPWLEGRTPEDWREAAMWEYDFRDTGAAAALGLAPDQASLCVWRGRRWKYVAFGGLPPLLFDLDSDPDCLENRAGDPACQVARLECAEALLARRMTHADRTLANLRATPAGIVEWRGPRRLSSGQRRPSPRRADRARPRRGGRAG